MGQQLSRKSRKNIQDEFVKFDVKDSKKKHCCALTCLDKIDKYPLLFNDGKDTIPDRLMPYSFTDDHSNALKSALIQLNLLDLLSIIASYIPNDDETVIFAGMARRNGADYLSDITPKYHRYLRNNLWTSDICRPFISHLDGYSPNNVTIYMCGANGVGKSNIVIRYFSGNFVENYEPAMDSSCRKMAEYNGIPITYEIEESFGNDEFPEIENQHLRNVNIVLVCYSVTDPSSLYDHAVSKLETIYTVTEERSIPVCVILVGCKVDLRCFSYRYDKYVSHLDAIALADLYQIPYIETSAKENMNIDYLFQQCLWSVWFQGCISRQGRLALAT